MPLKKESAAQKLGVAYKPMPQGEHYEIWIRDADDWMLKSSWRDFDVGLAAARALTGPVRIIHAVYDGDAGVVRKVVVEMGTLRDGHQQLS